MTPILFSEGRSWTRRNISVEFCRFYTGFAGNLREALPPGLSNISLTKLWFLGQPFRKVLTAELDSVQRGSLLPRCQRTKEDWKRISSFQFFERLLKKSPNGLFFLWPAIKQSVIWFGEKKWQQEREEWGATYTQVTHKTWSSILARKCKSLNAPFTTTKNHRQATSWHTTYA